MKKIFFKATALVALFGFTYTPASADIVIEGKATTVNQAGGNTYIKCRKRGECVRILSNVAVVSFEDGTVVRYNFSGSFETTTITDEDGDKGVDVVLHN